MHTPSVLEVTEKYSDINCFIPTSNTYSVSVQQMLSLQFKGRQIKGSN